MRSHMLAAWVCRRGGEESQVCLITLTPPLEEGLFLNLREKINQGTCKAP